MLKELFEKYSQEMNVPDNCYLVHVFIMPTANYNVLKGELSLKDTEIHFGFYNTQTKKIFSYTILNDVFEKIEEQEVFQKEKEDITQITLNEIRYSLEDMLKDLAKIVFEKYKNTISLKTLLVLQHLPEWGFVWNVTILRRDFKTLNIKFSVTDGKVLKESLESLIDMNKTLQK